MPVGAACGMSRSFYRAAFDPQARASVGNAYFVLTVNRMLRSADFVQRALDIMDLMLEVNVQPNIISYGTAISACARGGA